MDFNRSQIDKHSVGHLKYLSWNLSRKCEKISNVFVFFLSTHFVQINPTDISSKKLPVDFWNNVMYCCCVTSTVFAVASLNVFASLAKTRVAPVKRREWVCLPIPQNKHGDRRIHKTNKNTSLSLLSKPQNNSLQIRWLKQPRDTRPFQRFLRSRVQFYRF